MIVWCWLPARGIGALQPQCFSGNGQVDSNILPRMAFREGTQLPSECVDFTLPRPEGCDLDTVAKRPFPAFALPIIARAAGMVNDSRFYRMPVTGAPFTSCDFDFAPTCSAFLTSIFASAQALVAQAKTRDFARRYYTLQLTSLDPVPLLQLEVERSESSNTITFTTGAAPTVATLHMYQHRDAAGDANWKGHVYYPERGDQETHPWKIFLDALKQKKLVGRLYAKSGTAADQLLGRGLLFIGDPATRATASQLSLKRVFSQLLGYHEGEGRALKQRR